MEEMIEEGSIDFTDTLVRALTITQLHEYDFKANWSMRFMSGLFITSPGRKIYDVQFKAVFMDGSETLQTVTLSLWELNGRSDSDKLFVLKVALRSLLNFKIYADHFDETVQNVRVLDVSLQPPIFKLTKVGRRMQNRALATRVNPLQSLTD